MFSDKLPVELSAPNNAPSCSLSLSLSLSLSQDQSRCSRVNRRSESNRDRASVCGSCASNRTHQIETTNNRKLAFARLSSDGSYVKQCESLRLPNKAKCNDDEDDDDEQRTKAVAARATNENAKSTNRMFAHLPFKSIRYTHFLVLPCPSLPFLARAARASSSSNHICQPRLVPSLKTSFQNCPAFSMSSPFLHSLSCSHMFSSSSSSSTFS
jgi:hypothetical protein